MIESAPPASRRDPAAPRARVQRVEQIKLLPLFVPARRAVADVLDQLVELGVLRIDEGALKRAGQEARPPVLGFLDGVAAGAHTTKPGRFWFPRPARRSPRITLGRLITASPLFISMSDGSWFGTFAVSDRITAMSSMCAAVFKKLAHIEPAFAVLLE